MTDLTSALSILPEDWPMRDRLALEQALTPDDDGSGDYGQATHLRQAALGNYKYTYGQFLEFLARLGELNAAEGPGERATPARVAAWRRENKHRGLAPTSRRQALQNLGAFLRLIAPNRDWRFVIRPGNMPLKRAIRGGPKPFIVRDVADVMIHVRRLHREGLAAPDGPERWKALRDAAKMGVLLTRAPRIGSLVRMTIDRHIALRADGTWHIRFPGEDTKTGSALDFPLDAERSRMLTDYLQHARERFPHAETTDRLWMGMKGPMTQEGLKQIPRRRMYAWFGKAHGPHVFRKWLRASAARRAPELALDAAEIMGHSTEVSVQSYSEASGLHAAMRHGDRLAERRARHASRAERAFAAELARWEED